MIADHWFRQVEKILEAMETTSDATKIKLAAFQLEGVSRPFSGPTRSAGPNLIRGALLLITL